MKKLLTAVAILGVATLAFGQGQVNFLNTTTTLVSTHGGSLGDALAPTTLNSINYGLFWAPLGTTDPAAFTFVSYGTNLATAGRFLGGNGTGTAPAIAGQTVGTSVNVLIRGWSANFGTQPISMADRYNAAQQWTAVKAAADSIVAGQASVGPAAGFYYGQSAIGAALLGGGGTTQPVPNIFGTLSGQIATGFTLNYVPVPEPSTLALAGLGAASLLIFRRRK